MIRIQNIYYMLSYAFQVLKGCGYEKCSTENFENTGELLTAILINGISVQLKRGLIKEYTEQEESTGRIRGKLNITSSIKKQSFQKRQMICQYDEASVDCPINQVIKATAFLLLDTDISIKRKRELRKYMVYFSHVTLIDYKKIDWNFRRYHNNQTYQMLIAVCYLIIKGLLQTQQHGTVSLRNFLDEQRMSRLYEKFILEYYKKEFPDLKTKASQIQWKLDDNNDAMLPRMQTDILITDGKKSLIIDAKYYEKIIKIREDFKTPTFYSQNLYQIFTYVKNRDEKGDGSVAGLLLYAKTEEDGDLHYEYKMSGNTIGIQTLDLNQPFFKIAEQLDAIMFFYFGKKRKKDV